MFKMCVGIVLTHLKRKENRMENWFSALVEMIGWAIYWLIFIILGSAAVIFILWWIATSVI